MMGNKNRMRNRDKLNISILNDVLGPIMRGPSSSHTAGSFHIGSLVRDLLGETPKKAEFTFDSKGSYGQTYNKQNADKGFVSGLLDKPMIDKEFGKILIKAVEQGIKIKFSIDSLPQADHPNFVQIKLTGSRGNVHTALAKSTGGGGVVLSYWDGWNVNMDGSNFGSMIYTKRGSVSPFDIFTQLKKQFNEINFLEKDEQILFIIQSTEPLNKEQFDKIKGICEVCEIRKWNALQNVKKGVSIYNSLRDLEVYAEDKNYSLGQAAMDYEQTLLGISKEDCISKMLKRLKIMKESVLSGLDDSKSNMQLLNPTASKINLAVEENRVALGGPHTLAGVRAIAAMHTCNSGEVVCAAPTGGAAGVIPGVMFTLIDQLNLDQSGAVKALFAAGAIGWAVATQATFAAEVAGCQVEIGAAGAMAAAAVVEAAGGSVRQALDAAAIGFQNTMGSVCDLVQGICEIPCHTRNAAAASNAFLCADLILGGYENPIPLDETIDAVYDVGKMLPPPLRCTAKGGLAITPSALKIKSKKI